MMATTHVLAGLALLAPVAYAVPELAPALAVGAILGGLAPDADLLLAHRRTLHFPLLGGAVAVPVVALGTLWSTPLTVGVAAFAVAAWLHAASDVLGGGPEMDPWNDASGRAVYDHLRGRWLAARRWIRYDGAPEDAVVAIALAVPALLVYDGWVAVTVTGAIVISIGYALVRRRLVDFTPEWLE
ncbi:metal-dependent hydrolase [Halobacteria archaeon AArc-dxtr1]|nr:metal-dependent hydrolase [Halobacteria archaeon AArc-dxtr1]